MLDRVLNIKTRMGVRSEERAASYEKFAANPAMKDAFGKDSIIFSPAALYLAKLNWQLREINYPSKDKIFLDFYISDFHFQIEIDFLVFYSKERQTIHISRIKKPRDKRKRYSAFLSVKKDKMRFMEDYMETDLDGIKILFDRIIDLEARDRLVIGNRGASRNLISGIETRLFSDLQYIFAAIFTFIDKLAKFNVIKKHKFSGDTSEPVIIETIKVADV